MKYLMAFFITTIGCLTSTYGQNITKKALFIGNSYTGVNNLPQMIADVATSTGCSLIFDSNTPGGYTLQRHSTNATSLAKIALGDWDYVVLQEQSQYPSFPISQVEMEVFPYARFLDSVVNAENPCAETVFYMTWGRKNGDASNCASWPPVCTYSGMDSLLNLRYKMMADSNNAIVSPVGAVWKYIRQNFPSINLYQPDGSHPSVAGTYAAACCFFTVFFRKDPTEIAFNSTLSVIDATNIRNATKVVVYDSLLSWHVGEYDPSANFTYSISGNNEVTFTNNSLNATDFTWYFGDGTTSTSNNPTHAYQTIGEYTVQLIAGACGISDTIYQTINIAATNGTNAMRRTNNIDIYPNPVVTTLKLQEDISETIVYKIVSVTGEEVLSGAVNIFDRQIDVSLLSGGIYFLHVFDNNRPLVCRKFVKTDR